MLFRSYPDLPKWQTEYYLGNFMTTVQLIQNALTIENLNAYIFWGGVWFANVEKELDNLIGIDSGRNEEEWDYEHGYVIGEKFYSMKHFSEYILPNYIRIDCKLNSNQEYSTDEISSSAYISPNKDKVVIVSVNDTSSEQSFQFNIPKYKVNQSKIILSNYQNGIDSEDFYVDSGSLDDTGTFIIPAHSVITVVLDGQCQ